MPVMGKFRGNVRREFTPFTTIPLTCKYLYGEQLNDIHRCHISVKRQTLTGWTSKVNRVVYHLYVVDVISKSYTFL